MTLQQQSHQAQNTHVSARPTIGDCYSINKDIAVLLPPRHLPTTTHSRLLAFVRGLYQTMKYLQPKPLSSVSV